MELRGQHQFSFGRADVEDAMCDPAFYGQLEIPDVTKPEILDRSVRDGVIELSMRYVFTGQLDPIVNRVLGNSEISWTQALRVDTRAHTGSLTIVPSVLPGKVDCSASITFTDAADGGCTRVLDGELKVKIPMLGGKAEHAILPGITRRLDLEAEALEGWLQSMS